jgi:hypothetical protein
MGALRPAHAESAQGVSLVRAPLRPQKVQAVTKSPVLQSSPLRILSHESLCKGGVETDL